MTARDITATLQAVRDDRTLSANAKLCYLLLYARMPDVRPSMRTLAADMRVSRVTARKARDELVDAGWLEVEHRITDAGDSDTCRYILAPVGRSESDLPRTDACPPVGQQTDNRGSESDHKVSNPREQEKVSGDENRSGPRGAAHTQAREPAKKLTRDDALAEYRRAELIAYGGATDISDEEAVGLWLFALAPKGAIRHTRSRVAYLAKVLGDVHHPDSLIGSHLCPDCHEPGIYWCKCDEEAV